MINFCGLNKHDTLNIVEIRDASLELEIEISFISRVVISQTLSFLLHTQQFDDGRSHTMRSSSRESQSFEFCVTYRKMICLRSFSL